MRETWLRPNRRAIWFGCVPPLVLGALGGWLVWTTAEAATAWRWIGLAGVAVGLGLVAALVVQLFRPRIAYRDGRVLFYLRSGRPIAAPAGVIEAFFVGRGPAPLPGKLSRQETMNLVARISQRETDWSRKEVKHSLGDWCDGYVTIRGTWCEPLDPELIRRLNRRLREVKAELESAREKTAH
jgi:hypothetical protein